MSIQRLYPLLCVLWMALDSTRLPADVLGGTLFVDHDTLDFGTVMIGSCSNQIGDLVIANRGDDTLELNAPTLIGKSAGYFRLQSPTAVVRLPRNRFMLAVLNFCPKDYGPFAAQLVFASTGGSDTVTLIGFCVPRPVLRRDTIDFGTVRVDSCQRRGTKIVNTMSDTILLAALLSEGASGFSSPTSITDSGKLLAPGQGLPLSFDFCPKRVGPDSLLYRAPTDSGAYEFFLRGEGVGPKFVVDFVEIDFGDVWLDSTAERTITITNDDPSDLNVQLTFDDPAFRLPHGAPNSMVILPGDTRFIVLRFTPTNAVIYQARLFLHMNAQTADTAIPLRGRGVSPPTSRTIWLDSTEAWVGDTTTLWLHADPPLKKEENVTGYRVVIRFDPTSLWISGARPLAGTGGTTRMTRRDDGDVEIIVNHTDGPLEGDLAVGIDLMGLSRGMATNTVRIDSAVIDNVPVDSIRNGRVLLDGCSRRSISGFSRPVVIESITADGLEGEAIIRYRAPRGATGEARLIDISGNETFRRSISPGTGDAEELRIDLRHLPVGLHLLELRVADDRSSAPIMIGR